MEKNVNKNVKGNSGELEVDLDTDDIIDTVSSKGDKTDDERIEDYHGRMIKSVEKLKETLNA
jgi:hypothetical protein